MVGTEASLAPLGSTEELGSALGSAVKLTAPIDVSSSSEDPPVSRSSVASALPSSPRTRNRWSPYPMTADQRPAPAGPYSLITSIPSPMSGSGSETCIVRSSGPTVTGSADGVAIPSGLIRSRLMGTIAPVLSSCISTMPRSSGAVMTVPSRNLPSTIA